MKQLSPSAILSPISHILSSNSNFRLSPSPSLRPAGRRATLKKLCGLRDLCEKPASVSPSACLPPFNFRLLTSSSPSPKSAFSLLEIVVSTAIVAVLSLIMLQILSKMLDASKAETARMDAYANGRAVLELMGRDLRQTWVEQATTNFGSDWTDIPAGTEFNWRNIYANFNTNVISTNNSVQILCSVAIPVTRGGSESGLRAVGYGLSNSLLIRYQTVLTNTTDTTNGLWSVTGVTNSSFIITNYSQALANADIIAENIYWMSLQGASGTGTNVLPDSITLIMRTAPAEVLQRVRKNPALSSSLLYLTNAPITNASQITQPGVREISLTIPF